MAISYISKDTLAQLATLTNIGDQADTKRTTHCGAKLITNNSSHCTTNNTAQCTANHTGQYGTVNASKCTANHTGQYGTVNSTKTSYTGRCTGYYHGNG